MLTRKTIFYSIFSIFLGIGFLQEKLQAASPVSLLAGNQSSGSYEFATVFANLWKAPFFELDTPLVVSSVDSEKRLERLRLRQGDLAILEAPYAYQNLENYPEISVISVLWPNVLHAISQSRDSLSLEGNDAFPLRVHENSDYFVITLNQQSSSDSSLDRDLAWFSPEQAITVLTDLGDATMLVTAPYPMTEFEQLFQSNPAYKLIPFEQSLLVQNQQNFPWIKNHLLPAAVYSNIAQPLRLPTRFPVLVTRTDTDDRLVQDVLKVLFSQQDAIYTHALFRFLDPQTNQLFAGHFRYHTASQKFLNLQED